MHLIIEKDGVKKLCVLHRFYKAPLAIRRFQSLELWQVSKQAVADDRIMQILICLNSSESCIKRLPCWIRRFGACCAFKYRNNLI